LRVSKRINIFSLDIFHQGWFEVQDEGSQILPLLVDPKTRHQTPRRLCRSGRKNAGIFGFDEKSRRNWLQ